MNVLELGCGTGQLSLPLAPLVTTWLATDYSSNMITELKKRKLPNNLYPDVQDATQTPYDSEQFDAVIIANVLHIMPSPESALKEAYRVLKPGGILIAPTFIKDEHQNKWQLWLMKQIGFRIYNNWTAGELGLLIKQFDFSIEDEKILPGKPSSECLVIARR